MLCTPCPPILSAREVAEMQGGHAHGGGQPATQAEGRELRPLSRPQHGPSTGASALNILQRHSLGSLERCHRGPSSPAHTATYQVRWRETGLRRPSGFSVGSSPSSRARPPPALRGDPAGEPTRPGELPGLCSLCSSGSAAATSTLPCRGHWYVSRSGDERMGSTAPGVGLPPTKPAPHSPNCLLALTVR